VENERSHASGFSAIGVTAAFSVFVLVAAVGWEIRQMVQGSGTVSYVATHKAEEHPSIATDNPSTSSLESATTTLSLDDFSPIGVAVLDELVTKYTTLQNQGLYTEEIGEKVAEKMATTLKPSVSYTARTSSDINTDSDTSYSRMLKYRADLRDSLAPLLKNTQPEYEIFAYYVDTHDAVYLERLKEVAGHYREAVSATARVVAPQDAVREHVAILNAMEQFAATLDAMAVNATDPFASVVLLRSYNAAEADMLFSFKALASYAKNKSS
jgi:hypothetical protein